MIQASSLSTTCAYLLRQCVSCGGERIRYWRRKDYQYTQALRNDVFHIYRCDECGTGFLNQPPDPQWLEAIYQFSGQALTKSVSLQEILAREAAFPNCRVDAERMSGCADRFNASGNRRALDIGSGFGFYTQALKKRGYATVAINPGRYENQVFKALNGEEPLTMMFEQYTTQDSYGVVMMSQVLEHMVEPERALEKVRGLLAEGGVLACAVPNYASFLVKLLGTRDNACLWVPEHVNYFTAQGLQILLERKGLRVVRTEQVTRIRYDALSRRLGLTAWPAALLDTLTKYLQKPFAGLMNALGLGIYIHVYAVKVTDKQV